MYVYVASILINRYAPVGVGNVDLVLAILVIAMPKMSWQEAGSCQCCVSGSSF